MSKLKATPMIDNTTVTIQAHPLPVHKPKATTEYAITKGKYIITIPGPTRTTKEAKNGIASNISGNNSTIPEFRNCIASNIESIAIIVIPVGRRSISLQSIKAESYLMILIFVCFVS